MAAIHVEHIVLLMYFKDLKRAIIGLLQWAAVGIMANIHITSGCQVYQVCRLNDRSETPLRV